MVDVLARNWGVECRKVDLHVGDPTEIKVLERITTYDGGMDILYADKVTTLTAHRKLYKGPVWRAWKSLSIFYYCPDARLLWEGSEAPLTLDGYT